jgi:aspartate aminotransferase
VSYPDIVALSDATPVIIETRQEEGFKLTPAVLEKAVTPRTKAVIINSPSNPAGAAYSRQELEKLAEVIVRKDIIAISDDIYEKIIYDGMVFGEIAALSPAISDRTIVVNGLSKSYSMTGWRIGYAAGPENVIKALTDYQSQNTSNPASICQKAAIEALNGRQETVTMMIREFQTRRNFIVDALNDIPAVSCLKPGGAFYVFPMVSGLFGRSYDGRPVKGSADITEFLLEKADVSVTPGVVFGNDSHVRLSYATSMRNIEEGMKRIKGALSKLV